MIVPEGTMVRGVPVTCMCDYVEFEPLHVCMYVFKYACVFMDTDAHDCMYVRMYVCIVCMYYTHAHD